MHTDKIKKNIPIKFSRKSHYFARYQHYIFIVARSLVFILMASRTSMMSLWFNQENKWSKKQITTYCILCLSLGQAGQSNPLQNSEWRPSTWSQCYHILYIQSGNLSANNHKNKPLLEPVLTGELSCLYRPKWPVSKLYPLLESHPSPTLPTAAFP